MPIWTAKRTLRFLGRKNETEFEEIHWSNNELSFGVLVPAGDDELTLMIPKTFAGKLLTSVSLDGENVPLVFQSVKGDEYGMIALASASGDNHLVATYGDSP